MKLFIFTLLICLFSQFVYSAPTDINVTGEVSHGTAITITGSSFGTKGVAPPVKFETFESQSSGADVGSEGYWSIRNLGTVDVTYNNTNQRNGSNNAKVVLVFDGPQGSFYKQDVWGVGKVGKKFISAWVYVQFDNLTSSAPWQHKLWRVSTGPNHGDYIGSAYENWYNPDGSTYWHYYEHAGTPAYNPGSMSIGMKPGEWVQMQWEYDDSSGVGVADGAIRLTNLFPTSNDRSYNAGDNYILRTSTYPNPTSTPKFGYMVTNAAAGHGVTSYWDDIYIDNGWSRVELGNASTYDACTHREMQIPTRWDSSGDYIEITVNAGAFAADENVYLYVVDDNGDASLGYPVTIGPSGGTEDTTPPVRTELSPSGTLAYDTTSTVLTLRTDDAATCRYSTTAGTAYTSMTDEFDTASAKSHTATVTGLRNDTSYNYYVRCINGSGYANTDDVTISFSVAAEAAGSAGSLAWEFATISADREDVRIPMNIIRTGGSTGEVTVDWSSNGQTATHGVDYYGADNVTVTFADGVTTMPINTYGSGADGIEMIDNGYSGDRYFEMILSNTTGGATLGSPTISTVTINGSFVEPLLWRTPLRLGTLPIRAGTTPIRTE